MSDPKIVAIAARPDIFVIENDRRIGIMVAIFLCIGMLLGIWFSTMQVVEVVSDFFENLPTQVSATIVTLPPDQLKKDKEEEKKKPKEELKKKQLKAPKMITTNAQASPGAGRGDIKERVTQKGLLAIISGKAKAGANVAGATFMSNTFASDLDQVLNNIGGLKTAGKSGVGRMGLSTGKFGVGYTGGGGMGAGGIDDLLGNLAGGSATSVQGLTKRASVDLPSSKDIFSAGDNMAGRSPEEIYRVVMQHIGGLRAEYNKRLRANPMLKGKVTVRFAIEPSGRVAWCNVVGSTVKDKILELAVTSRVKTWQFEACGRCGVATVTYPFAFSQ